MSHPLAFFFLHEHLIPEIEKKKYLLIPARNHISVYTGVIGSMCNVWRFWIGKPEGLSESTLFFPSIGSTPAVVYFLSFRWGKFEFGKFILPASVGGRNVTSFSLLKSWHAIFFNNDICQRKTRQRIISEGMLFKLGATPLYIKKKHFNRYA